MEDVLAVYTRPHDPLRPLVCLDEVSKQLVAETRIPIPMKPGRLTCHDYEYRRNGTANLFMAFAPLEGSRHVKVTDRRTRIDYAHFLRDLADVHYCNADQIVLVQDNLNTHTEVVLVFRPVYSLFKVDHGFKSGCHTRWFGFVVIGFARGQDAMGRMGPFSIVVGQPLAYPQPRF